MPLELLETAWVKRYLQRNDQCNIQNTPSEVTGLESGVALLLGRFCRECMHLSSRKKKQHST